MTRSTDTANLLADTILLGLQLADAAAVADIEEGAHPVRLPDAPGQLWYDVRLMTDDREHSPAVIDMAHITLVYATYRGLIVAHPVHKYLMRITARV